MSTPRPDPVPFAGLRRNAVALVGGLLIVVAIFLFGIVAAVPVTTMVAVGLIGRRLPFVGEGSGARHAPGLD